MKYYELWITLANWKRRFTVREFRRVFASPAPNKVLHDMAMKGFLKSAGWGKYRVVGPAEFFRNRPDIAGSYRLAAGAGMKYAFADADAVFIWTKGGYQADRFAGFYPISMKVRRSDLKRWKSFFISRGRQFHVFGKPVRETLFGVFYVLYPHDDFRTEEAGGFSVMPLHETVEFCRKRIYAYEPALEMLDEMYGLGLRVRYRESVTNR